MILSFFSALSTVLLASTVESFIAPPRQSSPTDYSAYPKVEIVYAEVLQWEPGTDCRGKECIPLPLLKVRVAAPLHSTLKGEALFEVRYADAPAISPEPIKPGDHVLITFTRETAPRKWSCGKLRDCAVKPAKSLLAIELFRRLAWASE